MEPTIFWGRVRPLAHVWKCITAFIFFLMLAVNARAQEPKLAVINKAGEVWARNLSATTIGPGVKLNGPGLFGGPDDQFVVGSGNTIAVVTKSGDFWPRLVTDTTIDSPSHPSGSLFGGSDTKYVLYDEGNSVVYVVNTRGEVWSHFISTADGVPTTVGGGNLLMGPSLFGAPNDKYVVLDGQRILVINTSGEVWAHDLSCSKPPPPGSFGCTVDTVGAGHKLSGTGLFGGPNDKYVVALNGVLYVINTGGEVWAHVMAGSTVGSGVKLSGPTLFGAPNDKYVVTYEIPPPIQ